MDAVQQPVCTEMDKHNFYQNIRNGAKEAKRANSQRQATSEDARPTSMTASGRKTTRFDANDDDEDRSITRYNSDDLTKIPAGSGHVSRQPSRQLPMRDRSFHETIYSPRTERRRLAENLISPRAEGGFLGGRDNELRKSARRDRSREKTEDAPVLPSEDSNGRLSTENKLLKIEMDDVNNKLEVLKNDQENALHRLSEARKEMGRAEREYLNEIESLKEKVKELQADKTDLSRELDSLRKKKELLRIENERLRSEMDQIKDAAEYDQKTSKIAEKLRWDILKLEEELERKTKMLDKLMSENGLLKEQEHNVTKERDLEDRLGRITDKLDRKRQKLNTAKRDIENLKKAVFSAEQEAELRAKIEKLGSALKGKDILLEEAKRERRDAHHEKNEIDRKCKDLKDQFIELHAQLTNVQKANDELDNGSKELRLENNRLKEEIEKLKDQLREERDSALKLLRFSTFEEKVNPLKETIRERDGRIANLDKEVDTLRHAVHGYQKQIDSMRIEPIPSSSPNPATPQPLPDHAAAHRRLLEENARLLSVVDQYRHGPPVDLPRNRSNSELDETKRHLRASEDRVAQLEKWLDEIYNDKNFDVILKGQGKAQRGATLPDLPKRYILTKGSNDMERRFKPGFVTDRH